MADIALLAAFEDAQYEVSVNARQGMELADMVDGIIVTFIPPSNVVARALNQEAGLPQHYFRMGDPISMSLTKQLSRFIAKYVCQDRIGTRPPYP
jgi:hypothetical protein